jgi:putative flippase GtrA
MNIEKFRKALLLLVSCLVGGLATVVILGAMSIYANADLSWAIVAVILGMMAAILVSAAKGFDALFEGGAENHE